MASFNQKYYYKRGARPKQSFPSEESSPSAMAALSGNRLVSYGSHDYSNKSTLRVQITNNSSKENYNNYCDTPMSINKSDKNNNALYQYPKYRSKVAEYVSRKTYLTHTSDVKIHVNIKEENMAEVCKQNVNDSHSNSSFRTEFKSRQNIRKKHVTNTIKPNDCHSTESSSSYHSEKFSSQVESLSQSMSNLTVIDEDVTANVYKAKKMVNKVSSDDCICRRTIKLLHCRYCGHMLQGRVSMPCSKHPKNVFLMDVTACPKCRSPACECLSEVDTVTGVIVAPRVTTATTTTAAAARPAPFN